MARRSCSRPSLDFDVRAHLRHARTLHLTCKEGVPRPDPLHAAGEILVRDLYADATNGKVPVDTSTLRTEPGTDALGEANAVASRETSPLAAMLVL